MSLVKESSSFSGIYRLTKTTFYLKKNNKQHVLKIFCCFRHFLDFDVKSISHWFIFIIKVGSI
jgi:hypothetical protein